MVDVVAGTVATNYDTATSHTITVRETLVGALNSPRDTVLTINVTEAGAAPGPFTLAWTSAASELTNLSFSITPAPLVGDVVTLSLDGNSDMSSPFDTSDPNTVDSGEAASGSLTFTGIATPLTPGLTYARVNVVRGAANADSDVASITLVGAAYTGPGDIVAGAAFWGGLRAYSSATKGTAAIRIRASGDNAETDINTTAAGALDVAAVSSFLTTHGGNAFVTKIYDQSGNARHLVQATAGNQPQLVLSGLGALPVVRFTKASAQSLAATGAGFPCPQPKSASIVAKRTSDFTTLAFVFGVTAFGFYYQNIANTMALYEGAVANSAATDNIMHAFQVAYNGASSVLYVDNVSSTLDPGAGAGGSELYFLSSPSSPLGGDVCEVGEWPATTFNSTQAGNLDANQSAYWGI